MRAIAKCKWSFACLLAGAQNFGFSMSAILIIEQILNGLQFGVMLFLMAAGLTLIFGVMGLINLAHGSLSLGWSPVRVCTRTSPLT